jgi:hypothetical protein
LDHIVTRMDDDEVKAMLWNPNVGSCHVIINFVNLFMLLSWLC